MPHIPLNKKIYLNESLTYDDLLLLPGYTDFERADVSLKTYLTKKICLNLPLVSAPMDTVTESDMAISLAKNGALGFIHRNCSISEQVTMVKKVKSISGESEFSTIDREGKLIVGAALGVGDHLERAEALAVAGIDIFLIDTAHGYTKKIQDLISFLKKTYSIPIVAGNIVTGEAARALIDAGADILRVGVGPGSICTTRIVTGVGMPQLSALNEVIKIAKPEGVGVIADGGIKQIGDIAKALAIGADLVMLGSMFAGFSQSPGEIIEIQDSTTSSVQKFKKYRGMGSISAMKSGSASRYGQKFDSRKLVPEGVEGLVKFRGEITDFLDQVSGGLISSFYYVGAKNNLEFYQKSKFVKINSSGLKESHPHSIHISDTGSSYFS